MAHRCIHAASMVWLRGICNRCEANVKERSQGGLLHGADCHGWGLQEKAVIVIGGGDTGTDCIGTSVRHGAKQVRDTAPSPAVVWISLNHGPAQ